jgi:hypothetical protein
MKNTIKNKKIIASAVTLFIVFCLIGVWGANIKTDIVQADTATSKLSGYAWSETIGWISFESSTGGDVSIDSVGNLNGYAWSDNIGWVKFGGLSSFPASGDNAKLNGDNLTGWARACAGTVNGDCNSATRTDGWDGWISLSGQGYGVKLDRNSSYAWGSDVVGWIDFKEVTAGNVVTSCSDTKLIPPACSTCISPYTNVSGDCKCISPAVPQSDGSCAMPPAPITSTTTVSLIMSPTLVNPGKYCGANYTLSPADSGYICNIHNIINGQPVIDADDNVSGTQVSPGREYKAICTKEGMTPIQSTSKKCILNPTVIEI